MKNFIFTFGSGHEPYGDYYTVVLAISEHEARKAMYEACASAWSSVYNTKEAAGVDKYGLRFVPFSTLKEKPPCSAYCDTENGERKHTKSCKNNPEAVVSE